MDNDEPTADCDVDETQPHCMTRVMKLARHAPLLYEFLFVMESCGSGGLPVSGGGRIEGHA
jgi:hypothetical protein